MKKLLLLGVLLLLVACGGKYSTYYVDSVVECAKIKKELKAEGHKIIKVIVHENRVYEIRFKEK